MMMAFRRIIIPRYGPHNRLPLRWGIARAMRFWTRPARLLACEKGEG